MLCMGWGGGLALGVLARGGPWGAGDILVQLPYILHCHMVLRPKGTSHKNLGVGGVAPGLGSSDPAELQKLQERVQCAVTSTPSVH